MVRKFETNQPVMMTVAQPPEEADVRPIPRPAPPQPSRFPALAVMFAGVVSAFWVGVWGAYLWGYFGPMGLGALDLQQLALFAGAMVLPPFLFMAIAAAFARAHKMDETAEALKAATDRLLTADDTAARSAAMLGRAVRRELDALNAGLENAYGRLRALENSVQSQVALLDEAGARAEVRGQAIAARLTQESQRLESLGDHLTDSASRAAEMVAGRSAQLRAGIETAEGSLKMAAQALDVQAAGFRAAAQAASDAPHQAAMELDNQSKKIEQVSDAALARAEFVLARQEKHRQQMNDLLARLKEDGTAFETNLAQQRAGMEQAISALNGEARKFEMVTSDTERHLEAIMTSAAARANQLTASFSLEAERLKETSDAANALLTTLVASLRDAGSGAQTLIGESAAQAKQDARDLVGEAMAECDKLLRAAGEMAAEAGQIRAAMATALQEFEKHLTRLPTVAQGEAQRVRQLVQSETDQILDLSARTLSTLHARGARSTAAPPPTPEAAAESEGLKGLARKLTQRPKRDLRDSAPPPNKGWEMKTLLAAVESAPPQFQAGNAAALGALEVALADMAVDLEAIVVNAAPGDEDWKRYLSGDRAVFARKLASAIDDDTIDRITTLYREDPRFHDAADNYCTEFEGMLAKAKEGDGGGLLTSTILSADTGKIYLAIAYALGRL